MAGAEVCFCTAKPDYNVGMRRLLSIAAFVGLLAVAAASAQMRGGGRGSFGGHGGFAGHGSFGGHVGGGHGFGGMPPRGFSAPRIQSRGFNHGASFRQPTFSRRDRFEGDHFRGDRFRGDRFRGNRFRHHRFRNFAFENCFGCGGWWGSAWWNAGYYDPYWWWDSYSSYDEDREREIRLANEMNEQSLAEQRMLHEEDQDLYARPERQAQPRQGQAPDPPDPPGPATVLVFRDQHRQEVQNYAIVGSTLWVFGAQRTQKIPVAELDIPATAKANDERGVEFRVPEEIKGQ